MKCGYDSLQIMESEDGPTKSFCGPWLPENITSSQNFVALHFASDYFITRRGFKISFFSRDVGDDSQHYLKTLSHQLTRTSTPPEEFIAAQESFWDNSF